MSLMFGSDQILERSRGLTFDDVLLVPNHLEMKSRLEPNISTRLTKNFNLRIPIISANMDTVTGVEMACALSLVGGLGVLHRFMTIDDQVSSVEQIKIFNEKNELTSPVAASIGVRDQDIINAGKLIKAGANILTIDIAHGDSILMIDTIKKIKDLYPETDLIVGNLASPDAAMRLIEAGADCLKVGIGPGSMCTTRIVTGCGVPQLTAVSFVHMVAKDFNIPVIADGGIKTSGDVVKAIAAGADLIMAGSLFSGCDETPGVTVDGYKNYRGMASREAQNEWKNGVKKGTSAEGVATKVKSKGSVLPIIEEIIGGIRSGMTYINARNIGEVRTKARFMEISGSGLVESKPHGIH